MAPDTKPQKTHYELLGVKRTASVQEIHEAFRAMARLLHPDSQFYSDILDETPTGGQVEFFKQVNAAYHVLIDETKREAYDATLPQSYDDDIATDAEILARLEKMGLGDDVAKLAGVDPERVHQAKKKAAPQPPPASSTSFSKPTPPPQSEDGWVRVKSTATNQPKPGFSTANKPRTYPKK